MPGWHAETEKLQQDGTIQMAGIVVEQHPDRTKLFMQWKKLGWPVLVDPLNLLNVPYVPITLSIDEHGIVRQIHRPMGGAESLAEFVEASFEAPATRNKKKNRARKGAKEQAALRALARKAKKQNTASSWRDYGDALTLRAESAEHFAEALRAYRRSLSIDPADPVTHFRAGVAARMRYDSAHRQSRDFQLAVSHWSRSLKLEPNNYICRRRLEQYGPLLDKPYPFYDWVAQAREEIVARGETPHELTVPPSGSELAGRSDSFASGQNQSADQSADQSVEPPDPDGKVQQDPGRLVSIEQTIVPWPPVEKQPLRLHLALRTNPAVDAHWNNEVGPLTVWLTTPSGWEVGSPVASVPPRADRATSAETRRVEFELRRSARTADAGDDSESSDDPASDDSGEGSDDIDSSDSGEVGDDEIKGFALYYVCEGARGACLYRRQDFQIGLDSAPK